MKNRLLAVIAILLMAYVSFAGVEYITDADQYHISMSGINMKINSSEPGFCEASLNEMDGFSNAITNNESLPELPVYRRFIRVPEGGDISISYRTGNAIRSNLDKTGYHNGIIPHQPSWQKDLARPEFVIDNRFYMDNQSYPENIVTVERVGRLRGKDLAVLTICPVNYNAADNRITYYDGIDITVSFSEQITAISPRLASNAFEHGVFNMILEPEEIDPVVIPPAVYLIITHFSFVPHLGEFTEALAKWGYDVHLVTTSDIGTSADDITAYIANAYSSWDVAPSFVLFVGDHDGVAPHVVEGSGPWDEGHPTDLYHFTLDGDDYIPDLMYGRMSVSMPYELNYLINKTLVHYNDDFSDESAFRRIGFGACAEDGRWELVMGTHQYAMDEYFHTPDFDPDTVYAIHGDGTAEFVELIEDGIFLFNYSGHGSVTSLSNPELDFDAVADLTNTTYPLVIGNCCLTGKFDEECFAEAITNDEHAASAYIGASNSTYWDEDDIWERRLYDGIFDEEFAHLASFMYKGNLEVYLWDDESAEYYFQIYHSFGDPALTFYFGERDTIDVDMADYDYITAGVDEYAFYPSVAGSWVALSESGALHGAAITSAGTAIVPVTDLFEFPDTVTMIAHKPNFWKPFMVNIPTAPPANIAVVPESIEVMIETEVTITITDGTEPIAMADVFINGIGVAETLITDDSGIATVALTSRYGQILEITAIGSDDIPLGREELPVYGASEWETSVFAATPAIGLIDSVAIGLDASIELTAMVGEFGVMLHQPAGLDMELSTDVTSISVDAVPPVQPDIDVTFIKEGYQVNYDIVNVCSPQRYPEIQVVIAGTSDPVEGAIVELFETDADTLSDAPVIEGMTDSEGLFTGDDLIDCTYYSLHVSAFGFSGHTSIIPLVVEGRIIIELDRGALATVTGNTGISRIGRVTLIDPETYAIIKDGLTGSDGSYTFEDVPYFTYKVVAAARGCSRHVGDLTVATTEVTYDPTLENVSAPVLIIDNSSGGSGAATMSADIFDYFEFIPATVSDFDLEMLLDYELVIYSSGENESPLDVDELQILLEFNKLGGNIIIEGGEISYEVTDMGDLTIANELFHIVAWRTDNPRDISLAEGADISKSPLVDPAYLNSDVGFAEAGRWDYYMFDVVTPQPEAELLYGSSVSDDGGVAVKYDDDDDDGFRKVLLYSFDYITAFDDEDDAKKFLLNGIEYIREPDWGRGKIFGSVALEGRTDFSGVSISTGTDNASSWEYGLFVIHADPGDVNLTFTMSGFRDTTITTSVMPDGERWGIEVHMGIAAVQDAPLPELVRIQGPYPNPANASFAISWDNNYEGPVNLELLDVMGNLVLAESYNGSNAIVNCDKLDSGVYLYKIRIEDEEKTGRFVLIK